MEARAACELDGPDDQLLDELKRLDSYVKQGRLELEEWKGHLDFMAAAATELRIKAQRRLSCHI